MATRLVTGRIAAKKKPRPTPHSLANSLLQFVRNRSQLEQIEERQKLLRAQMMNAIEVEGEKDPKGSLFLDLVEPVEHDGKTYSGLKRERRVSTIFLEEDAEKLLADKGLLAEAQKTIVVLDQDEIYRLHQEGKISEEEIDSMFQERITWAFKPIAG